MSTTIEERKQKRIATRGMQPGKLPYELATMEIGGVIFKVVKNRYDFHRMRDRIELAKLSKPLAVAEFKSSLLHCRDLADPSDESLVMRIERLPNKEPS